MRTGGRSGLSLSFHAEASDRAAELVVVAVA
jgi:hypothetical protein